MQENGSDAIVINFDMLPNASFSIALATVTEFIAQIQLEFSFSDLPSDLTTNHDEYLAKVDEFIENILNVEAYADSYHVLKNSLEAVIYLLAAIEIAHLKNSKTQLKAFTLDFKSGIRAGAGTGSSAAFSVSTAAIFYAYAKLRDDSTFIGVFNDCENSRQHGNEIVSSWAFLSERIIHKTPSGLDNTVCTFGNVVRFTKQPREIARINPASTINIVLVNSGVSRDTGKVVGDVRKLKEKYPKIIEHVFGGMHEIVTQVIQVFKIFPRKLDLNGKQGISIFAPFLINFRTISRLSRVSHCQNWNDI